MGWNGFDDMKWHIEGCIQTTANVFFMVHDTLLAIEPEGHLWKLILEICRSVCIFSKINVKTLGVFRVEVIGHPVKLNKLVVMASIVKFRDVEIIANTK